jgi:hypothetical protein
LEGLAFAGVIGNPGESLAEWIDQNDDGMTEWAKKTRHFRQAISINVSLGALERFYVAAVKKKRLHAWDLQLEVSCPCFRCPTSVASHGEDDCHEEWNGTYPKSFCLLINDRRCVKSNVLFGASFLPVNDGTPTAKAFGLKHTLDGWTQRRVTSR